MYHSQSKRGKSCFLTCLTLPFNAVYCFFLDGHIQVKPLGVIWGKYGEFYNRRNTIMFDDIGRNFLMNPQNGLKVGCCHYPLLFLNHFCYNVRLFSACVIRSDHS